MKKISKSKIFWNAFIGGFLGIFLGFFLIVFFIFPLIAQSTSSLKVFLYSLEIQSSKDPAINLIVNRCNKGTNLDKVNCAAEELLKRYNYTKENRDYIFKTPTELLIEGGVCRDFALTYCSIMRKMNISCNYLFLKGHMVSYVDLIKSDGTYCIIDQGVECF